MANAVYFDIQTDYQDYLDLVTQGAPGVDVDLDGIMDAMAATENANLRPWSSLVAAYGWAPPQITTALPVIVGVPAQGGAASPFDRGGGGTLGGFPGGMEENTHTIDRFIVGGPTTGAYIDAMRRAAKLYLQLQFCYAKNGMLGGAVHGAKITGYTWQTLPIGGDATAPILWYGMAVHVTVLCYYQLKAS